MINKLLLVRTAYVKSDLLDRAGLSQFAIGSPVKVLPLAWHEEDQPSHYGYEFTNLSREALDKLIKFDDETDGTSLLDIGEASVPDVLKKHGLRVHPLN